MPDEPAILSHPLVPPDEVLRYAESDDGVIDLFVPQQLPDDRIVPLVVLVHGGFWRQRYDRSHLGPLARAFAARGQVAAVVEYRRVGGNGGWPVTALDVEAAVTALPHLLSERGIVIASSTVIGHSAGGQLVLWLAACGRVSADCFVALAPVADLLTAARDGLGDGAVQDLLGIDDVEQSGRYQQADPLYLFGQRTVSQRVILMHGAADDTVPVSQSRTFAARHPQVEFIEFDHAGHYEPIDPKSVVWPYLLTTVDNVG